MISLEKAKRIYEEYRSSKKYPVEVIDLGQYWAFHLVMELPFPGNAPLYISKKDGATHTPNFGIPPSGEELEIYLKSPIIEKYMTLN